MEDVPFAAAAAVVCDRINSYLFRMPEWLMRDAQEIRIRIINRCRCAVTAAYTSCTRTEPQDESRIRIA